MSYPGHTLVGGLTPLQRSSRCILQPQPTGQYTHVYWYACLCIYEFTQIHKFSFLTGYHTKAKEPSWPYYLPIANRFMPFLRVLAKSEMQPVLSRFWTGVDDSIFYDDNYYVMSISWVLVCLYLNNTLTMSRMWCKWRKAGLNSEFSFSKTGCLTNTKEPSLHY